MRYIVAFVKFWYDFIVGDDWTIAVAVAVAIAITLGLVQSWWLLPLAAILRWCAAAESRWCAAKCRLHRRVKLADTREASSKSDRREWQGVVFHVRLVARFDRRAAFRSGELAHLVDALLRLRMRREQPVALRLRIRFHSGTCRFNGLQRT